MEETISLKEILTIIKKRLLLIGVITLVAAIVAAVISFFVLTPIYQSSTQFIVNESKQDPRQGYQIDSGTIRTNVELINTYKVIITSNAILDVVIDNLDLTYSAGHLKNNISVTSEQNSQVVTVTVKDPDPYLATTIANETVYVFQELIPDIMNVDNVNILSEANTPDNPSPVEPKPMLNIAIAIVLGLMVGVGLAFLLEYFDTQVRTEQDVEALGIPIIGIIPTIESEDLRMLPNASRQTRGGGFQHAQTQKNRT